MAKAKNRNSRLEHVDLIGMLREIGVKKNMGIPLCKMILTMHDIYGSKYLIERTSELVKNPEKHNFNFNACLGKMAMINLLVLSYKHFDDINYYEAIKNFSQDNDERVKKYANSKLEQLTKRNSV